MNDVTQVMSGIESGDASAVEDLLPLVYDELRKLAIARFSQEKPGQTLQATAIVHEAYIRLVDLKKVQHWDSQLAVDSNCDELLMVDDALARLAAVDQQGAEIVKLRYFGGLGIEEAASVLEISRATAYRHWTYARAWIRAEILGDESSA